MPGLMGQGAVDVQSLIQLIEQSQGGSPGGWGGMHPSQGQNPIQQLAQMVMQGAGGMGGAGAFQTAVGADPMQAMQGGGQPMPQPSGPMQGQGQPMPQPMPELPPEVQAMQDELYAQAEALMDQMDPPIVDPTERMQFAVEYVATLMSQGGQQ